MCRWAPRCDERRRKDDHLSLVASITRGQRRELVERDIVTLERLAGEPLPLTWRPERGSVESLTRTAEQARIQSRSRKAGRPLHELLPREPSRGFALLPEPSEGDVFFDIEGDPFVGTGGLEYLFGFAVVESGAPRYEALWALDAVGEKAIFEQFVDRIMTLWAKYPGMHVYHYAPYEPSAMKRLMGRYGSRGDEIDRMLRAGLFVDLFRVVRQSVRAGVESYSIKRLEPLIGFARTVPLPEAGDARHELELALEFKRSEDVSTDLRRLVQGYNKDDCLSAFHLRGWLEGRRAELAAKGEDVPRPEAREGEASEKVAAASAATQAVYEQLIEGVPVEGRSDEQQARWLLAQILDFHRREEKTDAWEQRRIAEMDEEELFDERGALSGLKFEMRVGGTQGAPIDRYHFPSQDCDLGTEAELLVPDGEWGRPFGRAIAVDLQRGTIDIKKRGDTANEHPPAVYSFTKIKTEHQRAALLALGRWAADHGVDAPGDHRAARDLLLRRPPRLSTSASPLRCEGEASVAAACRLALDLTQGVLAIQGPPGAGKTYTGARLICALVAKGRKVGVIATCHKVIDGLLHETLKAAKEAGGSLRCGHKRDDDQGDGVVTFDDNATALSALQQGKVQVLGGTAWMWCRPEYAQSVDVLVVDEAGQFALANALAAAQAADNLVLLGDPRQLEQPLKASHPDGAAASALGHLLGDSLTIPDNQGLFLAETHRLHPRICAFTSELFYEDRLHARADCTRQKLTFAGRFDGAGLHFVPVDHEGNTSHSREEAGVIEALVTELEKARWTGRHGEERALRRDQDILVVAPYNAQVAELSRRLPGMRIGTVDKFQGQEAPVVILSMAASSVEDAPRGMDFLYSPHRLNVATSRAQGVCIVVASPRLFEPDCQSPKQMKLANALCRYRELASHSSVGTPPPSQEQASTSPSGFDLLDPAIQRRLWEMKWEALRPIQDKAIEHLIGRKGDCIIAAPTSGGKTEAAFLPILSLIAHDSGPGARVLYISPLKALINDQFGRIEDLCKRLDVAVHKWHGDVDQTAKHAFLTQPSGVLLMTPESLEAMFVLRPTKMASLFAGLAFVVIDELHALIGSVRGAQLQSQLFRLTQRCSVDPVRVGLSATIGDPSAACKWLRPKGTPATFLEDRSERLIAIRAKGYWDRTLQASIPDDSPDSIPRQLARDILRSCHAETNLVFANAKSEIEDLADAMKIEVEAMGIRHEVVVHHGSLSKEQREYAEGRLRRMEPCSAVCSNTLELGIDIGQIDNCVQVSAPWSVSSLAQRLGRSGRTKRGSGERPAVLRQLLVEPALDDKSSAWDGLHIEFLRGIATIELMLGKYVEPPVVDRAHLSTLVHQLLSTLAETGGCQADILFGRLMQCGAFEPMRPPDFALLLRALGSKDLIQQMEGGDLVLGSKGQRLCEHYSFYAAFASPEEFRVLFGTDAIGTLPASMVPLPGEYFILAGRRWLVQRIDAERREIIVVPGKGRRKPQFSSFLSGVGSRIHAAMLELVSGQQVPTYIDETARAILVEARASAEKLNFFSPRMREITGAERTQVFLWAGSKIQRTLFLALRERDLGVEDHEVGLEIRAPLSNVEEALKNFASSPGDGLNLSERAERECGARAAGDKYDWTLPGILWSRSFVRERLDISGAVSFVQSILRAGHLTA